MCPSNLSQTKRRVLFCKNARGKFLPQSVQVSLLRSSDLIWSNTNLPSYRDKVANEGGKKSIYDNRFPIILWLEDVFHNLSHPLNYYLRTSLSPRDVFGTAFRCLCKFLSPDWCHNYVFVSCRGCISWLGIFISHNNLKLFPWPSGAWRGNKIKNLLKKEIQPESSRLKALICVNNNWYSSINTVVNHIICIYRDSSNWTSFN